MIELTREIVSRETPPYKIFIDHNKISKIEEKTHKGNKRVKCLVVYNEHPYTSDYIYTSDSFRSIVRRIRKQQKLEK